MSYRMTSASLKSRRPPRAAAGVCDVAAVEAKWPAATAAHGHRPHGHKLCRIIHMPAATVHAAEASEAPMDMLHLLPTRGRGP